MRVEPTPCSGVDVGSHDTSDGPNHDGQPRWSTNTCHTCSRVAATVVAASMRMGAVSAKLRSRSFMGQLLPVS